MNGRVNGIDCNESQNKRTGGVKVELDDTSPQIEGWEGEQPEPADAGRPREQAHFNQEIHRCGDNNQRCLHTQLPIYIYIYPSRNTISHLQTPPNLSSITPFLEREGTGKKKKKNSRPSSNHPILALPTSRSNLSDRGTHATRFSKRCNQPRWTSG